MINLNYDIALIDTNTISRTCYRVYDDETQHSQYRSFAEREKEMYSDAATMANHYLHLPFLTNLNCKKQLWLTDSKPYWRKFIFPNYKNNRPPVSSELRNYIGEFAKNVDALSYTHYEADDLIAAYVRFNELKNEKDKENILIVTIDSDLLQLVSKNCSWICSRGYYPQFRSLDYGLTYWFNNKISKLGKKKKELLNTSDPLHIIKYKILCGDSSDNITLKNTDEELRKLLIDLRNPPKEYDAINIPFLKETFEEHKKDLSPHPYNDFYYQYSRKTNLVFPTRLWSQTC